MPMWPNARQRITPSEIAIAAAVLLLPPLVIGGVLYASLAPFDDKAAAQHSAWGAAADPATGAAADPAAGPGVVDPGADPGAADPGTADPGVADPGAGGRGVGGRAGPTPVDDAAVRAPTAAATPAAATLPKRSVRRHAQRPPPPQDDFPQQMKNWFQNVARDVGVLPRDGTAADAGR